jgi:Holliday junction resolvase
MSRYGRTKGHSFEREIAKQMRDLGFKDAQTRRAARGGDWTFPDDGVDLCGTPGFAIQCKRLKSYAPISCIEEIVKYEKENEIRLLLTQKNRGEVMAVLPWEDLKRLIAEVKRERIVLP